MKYRIAVILLLMCLLFSGFSLPAKTVSAASSHPRLYFTAADIPNLQAEETASSHSAIWNYLVLNANASIGSNIGLGSYDITEQCMHNMSLVYALTGDTKYANQLKTWCLLLAAQTDWGIPGWGQEPFAAATTSMSFAYDVLYDYLTTSERTTISKAIINQVNTFYNYYLPDYPQINEMSPNVSMIVAGAIGIAGLALKGEYSGAATWVSWAEGCADHIINVDGDPDGGWFEGPNYAITFRYIIAFFDALERVNGDNQFTNSSFLKNLPYYFIWCTYNNQLLPIEDTDWSAYYDIRGAFVVYRLAYEYNNGYAQWFASVAETQAMGIAVQGGTTGTPLSFLYLWKDANLTATNPSSLPLTRQFSGLGYVFYRTGWTNNDYVLLFKSGTSRGHAHADQNSWSLFGPTTDGVISGNPGYLFQAVDDATKNSNTILSNGYGQAQEPGENATAPLGTTGVIQQVDTKAGYIYIRGNGQPPYINNVVSGHPELSSGDLTKWLRSMVVINNPFYFVIYDDVAAPQAEQIDWNFLGNGGTFTVNSNTITLSHGINLNATIVEPSSFTATQVANTRTQVNDGATVSEPMVRIDQSTNTAAAKFLVVMFPGATLPVTEIKQGNLLGVIVNTDATHKDLILYSTDGQPVNQMVELGGQYVSNDGQSYTFNGTKVQASFSTYTVMRLIARKPVKIILDNLNQTYDGNPKLITYNTDPLGVDISIEYNDSLLPPMDAGIYKVVATVTNSEYVGQTTGTLTIDKASSFFNNLSSPTIRKGTVSTTLSGTIKADFLIPGGSVSISLNRVTQIANIDENGFFSSTFNTKTLGMNGSPYSVIYDYDGDTNINGAIDTSHLLIVNKVVIVTVRNLIIALALMLAIVSIIILGARHLRRIDKR